MHSIVLRRRVDRPGRASVGSFTGGCVEAAVVAEALDTLAACEARDVAGEQNAVLLHS